MERLRAREQRHKAQLTRDRKKLASLGLAISKLQRAIEAEETETEEEASERSGRLAEAELERGTLQFHEAQWIAEVESSQRWITRLEDANLAAYVARFVAFAQELRGRALGGTSVRLCRLRATGGSPRACALPPSALSRLQP